MLLCALCFLFLLPPADAEHFSCSYLIARWTVCVYVLIINDGVAAAGAEAEADGVAEVTKQLEKQAIEDKDKEEDGEEGECQKHLITHYK